MPSSQSRPTLTRLFTSKSSPTPSPPLTPTTFSSLLPLTPSPLSPTIHAWLRSSSPPPKHPQPHAYYDPLTPGSVRPRSRSSNMAHERSPEWRGLRAGLRVCDDEEEEDEEGRGRGRGRARCAHTTRQGHTARQEPNRRCGASERDTLAVETVRVERRVRSAEPQGRPRVPVQVQRSQQPTASVRLEGGDTRSFESATVVLDRRRQRRQFHGFVLQGASGDGHFAVRPRSQEPRGSGRGAAHLSTSPRSMAEKPGQPHTQAALGDGSASRKTDIYLQVPPQMTLPQRERLARSRELRNAWSVSASRRVSSRTGNIQEEKKPLPVYHAYSPGQRARTAVSSPSSGRQDRHPVELEVPSPCTASSAPRPTELMYDVGCTVMGCGGNNQRDELVVGDVRIPGALVPGAGVWTGASWKGAIDAGVAMNLSSTPQIGALDVGEEFTEALERYTRG